MQKLVSELSGAELDYCVGMAEKIQLKLLFGAWHYKKDGYIGWNEWSPTKRPEQAYPIIERDNISMIYGEYYKGKLEWRANGHLFGTQCLCTGETALIAAMRCKVASVYGETIECVI